MRGWSIRPSGPTEAEEARFKVQAQQIALVQPDVILLQEVNPLPRQARAYVAALKEHGVEYAEVHQEDACGVRLFGLGIVTGLNNGVAVLAKAPLHLRKVMGLKLSGGPGGCTDFVGFQVGELR